MSKTRKLIHIHCKQTNEDWYFVAWSLMKPHAYLWPISIDRIQRNFMKSDYFERRGFYFRKSLITYPTLKTRRNKPFNGK